MNCNVVIKICSVWMPILCEASCAQSFQATSYFQNFIRFLLCFGVAIENVHMLITQGTALSDTRQDASIAVREVIHSLDDGL